MKKLFNEHPEEVGMTYFQHFWFALNLARQTGKACFASLIHAFLPFLFTKTTSNTIFRLHDILKIRLPKEGCKDIRFIHIPDSKK